MKILIIAFFLLMSMSVLAQNSDAVQNKLMQNISSNPAKGPQKSTLNVHIGKTNPLYIIDGKLIDDTLANIDRNNILEITVLGDSSILREGQTAIMITTKSFAIKSYQNKLAAFSREYENYLKNNKGDDIQYDDIQYVIHNEPIESKGDELTNILYKIPPEKIIGVTFTEQPRLNGIGTSKVVIIETKIGE